MWHKTLLVLTATVALGSMVLATDASARDQGEGDHNGDYQGEGDHNRGDQGDYDRGDYGGGFGFYGPAYSNYGAGCYQWRRIWTPYGWRARRVNVCNY